MLSSALRLSFAAFVVSLLALAFTLTGPRQAEAAVENLGGCTSSSLGAVDDTGSQLAPLPFTPNFFGTTYNQAYVNNNGNVTFSGPLGTFTPENLLSTAHVIIAPFWADVDTTGAGSGATTYGNVTFNNRPAFCVNWVNVGYFNSMVDKTNSFQLLLVDRSDIGAGDFDMVFNYDRVQWETGDASGGTNGLGGNSARMGYSNGSDTAFEYPGSAVNGAFLDNAATGLSHNSLNSVVTGRYIFNVRGGAPPGGGSITGRVYGPPENARAGIAGNLIPMVGATVTACAAPPCSSTVTNEQGEFTVAGLDAGDYRLIAYPPAGRDNLLPADTSTTVVASSLSINGTGVAGGTSDVGQLNMEEPDPPPAGSSIDSIGQIGGAPVLDWGRPSMFSVVGCEGGTGTWTVTDSDGRLLASGAFSQSPPGQYNGIIPGLSPYHGPASVNYSITNCPDPQDNRSNSFSVYIDPSGNVLDLQGQPVAGATATLYRSDSPSGPFEAVSFGSAIMSPSNRTNPDLTDAEGGFHWDTIPGYYIVRAEKAGCHAPGNPGQAYNETDVLPVPPPQLDLEIRLDCGGGGGNGDQVVWGDVNCSGGAPNPIDSLLILREDAGIGSVSTQGNGCPDLNTSVIINQVARIWGDVDCSLLLNPIDSLKVLRFDAGLFAPKNDPTCPDIGDSVTLGGGTQPPTNTPVVTTQQPTQQPTQTPTPTPTPTTPPPTDTPTPAATQPSQVETSCEGDFDPIAIPDDDPDNPVTLFFNPTSGSVIDDMDICINVNHTWVGDLFIELEHMDTGTTVVLLDRPGIPGSQFGCQGNNIRAYLADEAAAHVEINCSNGAPALFGDYRPHQQLSAFDGETFDGEWEIRFADHANVSGFTGEVLGATIYVNR